MSSDRHTLAAPRDRLLGFSKCEQTDVDTDFGGGHGPACIHTNEEIIYQNVEVFEPRL